MQTASFISKKEQIFLFSTILFALLLRIFEFVLSAYPTAPNQNENFGLYDIFDMTEKMSPIYSFAVFFICVFLSWKINPATTFLSCFLTFCLAVFFDMWLVDTRFMIYYAANTNASFEFKQFDFILLGGSLYDVLTLFIVSFLLFWQASLFVRMLKGKRQNKFQ